MQNPDSGSEVTSIWIFQGNPNRYNLQEALTDPEIDNKIHWKVNQHSGDIQKGHKAIIWLSGAKAGIYAIGEILTNPAIADETEAERKYWTDNNDAEGVHEQLRVLIQITQPLLTNPILRTTLLNTSGLENLSILKMPQGTNFKVTDKEWAIIERITN